ncbi:MAG: MFS transporter [Gordonibacter pamelaeae]
MAPIALAGIAFVVLIVGAFLLRWQPQEVGLLPDGMTAEEAAAQAETAGAAKLVGLTRGEALKTTTFWFIAIAFALIGIGEQGPFQNFPAYIVGNGFDLAVAGAFMTAISLSGVVGKLASGVIIDVVGPRIAYCILNSLAVIGLVLIIFVGDNIVLLFASSILFGVALSSSAVCFSTATAMYLGPKHFGAIYGFVFLGKPICDAIGVPLVAAYPGPPSASPARSASAPCSWPARPSPCSWCARTRSSSRWRRRPPRSFRRKWRPNSSNAPEFALRARPGAWKKPRLQGG